MWLGDAQRFDRWFEKLVAIESDLVFFEADDELSGYISANSFLLRATDYTRTFLSAWTEEANTLRQTTVGAELPTICRTTVDCHDLLALHWTLVKQLGFLDANECLSVDPSTDFWRATACSKALIGPPRRWTISDNNEVTVLPRYHSWVLDITWTLQSAHSNAPFASRAAVVAVDSKHVRISSRSATTAGNKLSDDRLIIGIDPSGCPTQQQPINAANPNNWTQLILNTERALQKHRGPKDQYQVPLWDLGPLESQCLVRRLCKPLRNQESSKDIALHTWQGCPFTIEGDRGSITTETAVQGKQQQVSHLARRLDHYQLKGDKLGSERRWSVLPTISHPPEPSWLSQHLFSVILCICFLLVALGWGVPIFVRKMLVHPTWGDGQLAHSNHLKHPITHSSSNRH